MDDKTILTFFAFGTMALIFLALYCVNRRWEKLGYHDELNQRKQVKEKW